MAAKTLRNLIAGSGTITVTSSSRVATFSANQTFKPGTCLKTNGGKFYTIDSGAGQTWTLEQPAGASESGVAFSMTDTGTGRGRGSSGDLVPDAVHYVYQSSVDDAGSPRLLHLRRHGPAGRRCPPVHPRSFDGFVQDREVGRADHPRPQRAGATPRRCAACRPPVDQPLAGLPHRDLVARAYAIERYLNSLASVPAVGVNATYSEQQFMDYGDPA